MRRRIELDTEEVLRLKQQGLSDPDVAKLLGVSNYVVRNWRRMYNIPSWINGKRTNLREEEQRAFRQSMLPKVIEMVVNQGMSKAAVSRELGINIRTMSMWLEVAQSEGVASLIEAPDQVPKEQLIYDYLCWYKRKNDGNSPTRMAIAKYLNLTPSGLGYYLDLLQKENKIVIDMSGMTAGHIAVVGGVWRPPMGWARPVPRSLSNTERQNPSIRRTMKIEQYSYDFICIYKSDHDGNAPSLEQIATHVNAPKIAVYEAIEALVKKRVLQIQEDKHSNKIRVVGANWWPPSDWREPATPMKQDKVSAITTKRRNELKRNGKLCACGKGETHWKMTVKVGKNGASDYTYNLCDNCAKLAVEGGDTVTPIS